MTANKNKKRKLQTPGTRHRSVRVGLFLLLGILLYVSMLDNVQPEQLDVTLSEPAPEDIRSPITVEHEALTAEREQEALDELDPSYVHRNDYVLMQTEKINTIFELATEFQEAQNADTAPLDDHVEQLQATLEEEMDQSLPEETLEILLNENEEQLMIGRDAARNAVHEVMNEEIAVDDVPAAREEAEERISMSMGNTQLQNASAAIASRMVTANYIYDDENTAERREEALDEVEPVLIREGEILAQEGEIIDAEIYEQLSLTGLLDDEFSSFPYLGLLLFVGMIVTMVAFYAGQTSSPLRYSNQALFLYVLVFFIMLATMKVMSVLNLFDMEGILWLTPIALGTMLLAQLISYRVALYTAVLLALVGSVIFNAEATGNFHATFMIYALFSGLAGVFFLGKTPQVAKILQSGAFIALMNGLTVTSFYFLSNAPITLERYGVEIGFAVGSGFLAAVLTLGLMPFFETGFNILSKTKLIELSNANQPLLRKILLEAPGTYHHSIMVANLSEAACEAIGTNGLLARVGAYYHDLGKTKRPQYFIENQMKIDNPHDRRSPDVSKQIIIDHPYDGARMLEEHHFPKQIVDFAKQHHGTSLLKYFYHKAKEKDMEPDEADYRYPGPKAQFKESAVLGIADSVEAAVRSMEAPTGEKIEKLVNDIIRDRLVDGQFDECDLTMKELSIIANTMCETLQGTFHSRIEYPENRDVKEKKANDG
ncbi:HD family phosphohydrolase [Salicibibacter kimchii]|uniref:HDIG domain-containing protein n=1 Tax=Salicibibacter kimchii TaxID=2099786 RepID=A0A345BUR1_9BACI|nr:HD family phosphohydrolase [Salicibibacter kimchii]AXF54692.1 HDIG domain-containing protein [Salicibibacter kimchii]